MIFDTASLTILESHLRNFRKIGSKYHYLIYLFIQE